MNSNQLTPLWFAVRTKPRRETLAKENLQRQDFETYLPLIKLKKRKRNKWTNVIEPLFPCYAFVHVDPDQTNLAPIRSTLGVTGLVRFGNALIPVPDNIIEFLKQTESPTTGLHDANKPLFQKGDKVEIMDGPFAGIEGIFQMQKGEDRVMILIELLGRQNKVAVELDIVSKR